MYLTARVKELFFYYLRTLSFYYRDSFRFPLVTVVVPVYNESAFLHECLESIALQTYRNLECIIVNDGSTDESPAIIDRFTAKDKRFRAVQHTRNKGLPASRNTGLQHSRGTYITFLDGDDMLLQHSLWHRIDALEKNPSPCIAGSYCGIIQVPNNTRLTFAARYIIPFRRFASHPWKDFVKSRGECPFNAHAPLLKTAIIKRF